MPRGGRRAGAGRKPKATDWERLEIGRRCEELYSAAREVAEEAERQRVREGICERFELNKESDQSKSFFDELKEINVNLLWKGIGVRKLVVELASTDPENFPDDLPPDLGDLIERLRSMQEAEFPRVISLPHRPPITRAEIVRQVADEWQAKAPRRRCDWITLWYVSECWDDYRALASEGEEPDNK